MTPTAQAGVWTETRARDRGYQICERCIMDTSDPAVTFDEAGVCCYCQLFDTRMRREVRRGEEGRQELMAIAERMKKAGRGKQYDCLIGVSGGADSTMAAWTLKKLGLRVLAIHLDNGWNSELAVDNIKRMLDRLGIDLYTHVLDWEEFRDLQLAFLKASVPNCEIPTDHAIVALHFKLAAKQGIKYIVNGGNVATEGFMPDAWAYNARDLRHLKAVYRRFGTGRLRSFPTMGVLESLHMVFGKGIRWVTVLNYVDYRKTEAIRLLQQELGWRPYGGKHFESVYTRFYQGYILPKKFGFDKHRAHLANLVMSGELTRDEALVEIQKQDYIGSDLWAEDRDFVIKKLGLTEPAFEALMNAPAKTHYCYPTSRLIFEKMPRIYAVLKRVATRP